MTVEQFLLQLVLEAGHKARLVTSWDVGAYRYYQCEWRSDKFRVAFRRDSATLAGGMYV